MSPLRGCRAVAAERLGVLAGDGRAGVATVGHGGAVDVARGQIAELMEVVGDLLLARGVEEQRQAGLVVHERVQVDTHQPAEEDHLVMHDHHRRQLRGGRPDG
eukprot:scaffold71156_cov69-Phaeocystis_antarctica.AAC.5